MNKYRASFYNVYNPGVDGQDVCTAEKSNVLWNSVYQKFQSLIVRNQILQHTDMTSQSGLPRDEFPTEDENIIRVEGFMNPIDRVQFE